ncbi:MAG: hypothetical protein H7836_04515 [Magnetococcus sp. YQC-3]
MTKKRNIVVPHQDVGLNALRILAVSTVGYYLYKSFRKEGSLLGATGKDIAFNIDTDRIVEGVAPKIGLDRNQTNAIKNVAHQIKNEIINKNRKG